MGGGNYARFGITIWLFTWKGVFLLFLIYILREIFSLEPRSSSSFAKQLTLAGSFASPFAFFPSSCGSKETRGLDRTALGKPGPEGLQLKILKEMKTGQPFTEVLSRKGTKPTTQTSKQPSGKNRRGAPAAAKMKALRSRSEETGGAGED